MATFPDMRAPTCRSLIQAASANQYATNLLTNVNLYKALRLDSPHANYYNLLIREGAAVPLNMGPIPRLPVANRGANGIRR